VSKKVFIIRSAASVSSVDFIHAQTPLNNVEMFLFQLMLYNTEHVRTIVSDWPCDPDIPLLLSGDFNTEASNDRLKQCLNDRFRLVLATDPTDFFFKNTTIDLTFSRDIGVACKSYISYYSYHCPALSSTKFY
jgi:hypothetical protein